MNTAFGITGEYTAATQTRPPQQWPSLIVTYSKQKIATQERARHIFTFYLGYF